LQGEKRKLTTEAEMVYFPYLGSPKEVRALLEEIVGEGA